MEPIVDEGKNGICSGQELFSLLFTSEFSGKHSEKDVKFTRDMGYEYSWGQALKTHPQGVRLLNGIAQ